MGNLLSSLCVPLLHWFRLFGWFLPFLYLLYRSPFRTLLLTGFYYGYLSRQTWWIEFVRRMARLGFDKRFHLHKHNEFDQTKQYLICVHPHGIYCEGVLYSVIIEKDEFERTLPGIHYQGAGADQVSYLPLFRELMDTPDRGLLGVSKKEILEAFKKDPTVSIGICPGGFAEAVFTDARNMVEYSYLKGRKGFLKLAIEAGVDVLPVYMFGLNKLYHTPRGLRGLRARLAQKFALPMVIPSGWFGTNQPLDQSQVHTVIGTPFPASQYSLEEIDRAHADYCAVLKNLYDTYKDEYNDGKPLVFIGKDFHDRDVIPSVFRRLGVHTSHVIPGTTLHKVEIQEYTQRKRVENLQRLEALEAEKAGLLNQEL